jgi:hypothetical protein
LVFANVLARVKKWRPRTPNTYDPGYGFTERRTEEAAQKATKHSREEFLKQMSDLSTLLNDAKYYRAFTVVQAYNLGDDGERPTKAEYNRAIETMKRIEHDKGLKGASPQSG